VVRVHPDPPNTWGHSSAGRAPALQAGGRRFEPAWLHHSDPLMMGMAGGAVGFFDIWIMRIYRALQVAVFLFFCFFVFYLFFNKMEGMMHRRGGALAFLRGEARNGRARQRHGRRSAIPNALGLQGQVTKRTRWMPWRSQAMKDVAACEKLRGAGKQALIRRSLNGETHPQGYRLLNP
jgi:hypothetical protein